MWYFIALYKCVLLAYMSSQLRKCVIVEAWGCAFFNPRTIDKICWKWQLYGFEQPEDLCIETICYTRYSVSSVCASLKLLEIRVQKNQITHECRSAIELYSRKY